MGTRGVTGYKSDGKWFVAYNHWDSYPDALGMDVLSFCKKTQQEGWEKARKNLKNLQAVNEETPPSEELIARYSKYSNTSVNRQSLTDWYCLLRETQGVGFLQEIENGNLGHFIDYHTFMADSLFCEWGYIIDLDANVLRVYKGFNRRKSIKTVLPEDIDKSQKDKMGYYPVKEVATIPLDNLPDFLDDNGKPVYMEALTESK